LATVLKLIKEHFRLKLAVAIGAIALAAAFAVGIAVEKSARTHLVSELASGLYSQARVAALEPERAVSALSAACGCRVTVIGRDGAVIADSEVAYSAVSSMENHAHRPEVAAALSGREGRDIRRSATMGHDFLYVSAPVPEGRAAVMRLSLPLSKVYGRAADMQRAAFYAMAAVLPLALLAALWAAWSLGGPVGEMSLVAEKLSGGDYGARIRNSPADEHGRLAAAINLLAQKTQSAMGELARDRALLSAILSNMTEAVAAVDKDGNIIFANEVFAALARVDAKTCAGRPLVELLRNPALNEMAAASMRTRAAERREIMFSDAPDNVFDAVCAPLIEDGRCEGAVLAMRDISRVKKLEQMRRDFVANVSHELRTPLTSIRAAAQTLLDGALEDRENRRSFAQAIEEESVRLGRLIEDILSLSAIESGRTPPRLEAVNLGQAAAEVCLRLGEMARAAAVSVSVDRSMHELPPVRADKGQLLQVFRNLIENAIKFNIPGGTVEILARAASGKVHVSVRDTGIGIPAADLPRVFERFYRVDKARSREMGGTGLGLSIVRHITEAHGGSVSVESVEGKGSVFTFTLAA